MKGAVAKNLFGGAAQAALAGRTDAFFDRLCTTVAELAEASVPPGSPSTGKQAALCLLSPQGFAEVARLYDGDMSAMFHALQQALGWSAQQAAAALLQGIGQDDSDVPKTVRDSWAACPMPHPRSLLSSTAQQVEAVASMLKCVGFGHRCAKSGQLFTILPACLVPVSAGAYLASSTRQHALLPAPTCC